MKTATKKSKQVSLKSIMKINFNDGTQAKKYGTIFSASQDKFSIIQDNRGKTKGYDDNRITGLMEKIDEGSFIWLFSTIKVIYKRGKLSIVDGANRVTAVRKLILEGKLNKDYQIPFTVINDAKLQKMSKNDLISFMADMNNYDPRWKENEHFEAALSANLKTAMMFDKYLRKIKSTSIKNRLSYTTHNNTTRMVRVKYNILLSLATRTPIRNNGTKVVFGDFRNDDFGNYMLTNAFENDFDALIDFLEIAKGWQISNNIRISKSIFRALDIVFNEGIKVDFNFLVGKLKKVGNKMPKNDGDIKSFLTNVVFN